MKKPLPAHLVHVENIIKRKSPERTSLNISRLTDEWLKQVIDLLAEHDNPWITSLDLSYGMITNAGIEHFASMPKQIDNVHISRNRLDDGAAPLLMKVFQHVEYLNISDNCLSQEDGAYLAEHSTQIWLLVAGNRRITEDDWRKINARNEEHMDRMYPENKATNGTTQLSKCERLRLVGSKMDYSANEIIIEHPTESKCFDFSVD